MKTCEYCQKKLTPSPSELAEGRKTTRKRFCSKACAGLAKTKKRPDKFCKNCNAPLDKSMKMKRYLEQEFCSSQCSYEYRLDGYIRRPLGATVTSECKYCKKDMEHSPSVQPTYCSKKCMANDYKTALKGKANPNYGNRNPGMWQMPAEIRLRLSKDRSGKNNPNYVNGKQSDVGREFLTGVSLWAFEKFGNECVSCQKEAKEIHHIIPRSRFLHVVSAHFSQNLIPLCIKCHRNADFAIGRILDKQSKEPYPFADRLPESILYQLIQDGLVSLLHPSFDYSPLGNVADLLILQEWYCDKVEEQV